jgi:C1A family cysteine protease
METFLGGIQMRKIKNYGWQPDLPHSHKKYAICGLHSTTLPSLIDLRLKCPPVYDQGNLGSCTANGIAAAIEFVQPGVMPSRLFIYYNERVIEGCQDQDAGAQIHDGIKTINNQGACTETDWPYDEDKFSVKPSDICYADALKDLISDYISLDTINDIKQCLNTGYPVVFGMTVYSSFEDNAVSITGMVPMPANDEEVIGGHCMMIVGYDDSKQCFIVRNSWGMGWGLSGYCYIPYEYISTYATDFWCIK